MKITVRHFLTLLTRSWVIERRLPIAFRRAPLLVSPLAGLKYLFRPMADIDTKLQECARRLVSPGDIVWDIGANVGLFSFAAAAMSGSAGIVVAIEPDFRMAQLLTLSSRRQSQHAAPVMVVPVAVAAEVELREFSIVAEARTRNHLAEYGRDERKAEMRLVPSFNLDWLLEHLPPPNLIKCDVEGAEIEVFENQRKMLEEVRPLILCEVGKEAAPRITSILLEFGYRIYDGDSLDAGLVDSAPWNTLAVPKDRAFSLTRSA
jgi:FkbM family methyltransferase